MKLTNGDVFRAREPLQKLMGEKFPVKTAYGLAKLFSKLNEQWAIIEEVRNGLVRKYGELVEKGQTTVKQDGENFAKFVDEFGELLDQEVEIVFDKVKLPEMVVGKTFEIEPDILVALGKFVEV